MKIIKVTTTKSRQQVIRTILRNVAPALSPHMAHEVLRENLKDFTAKAFGGNDREGVSWEGLSARRIQERLRKLKKTQKKNERRQRRREKALSRVKGADELKELITKFQKQGAGTGLTPAQVTQRAIEAAMFMLGMATKIPIHIDTRRMIESLHPGTISSGKYSPPRGQKYIRRGKLLKVSSTVPWSKWAHDGNERQNRPARPIVMSNRLRAHWARNGVAKGRVDLAETVKSNL